METAKKSLSIAQNEGYRDYLSKNYLIISEIYEAQKKYKQAIDTYKLANAWEDSLFNQAKMNEFADLQVRFKLEQKEKENELLRKDNEIQRLDYAREYNLRNSLMIIILLAVLVVGLLIHRQKSSKKTNKLLQAQNAEILSINYEKQKLIEDLQEALSNVKLLTGLLPICAQCKKIRDDKGYWSEVESYVSTHTDAQFSHSLCPDCIEEYMHELNEK